MAKRYYGWKRQLPDQRDVKFQPPRALALTLPNAVDLGDGFVNVNDQGQLGSCGPNAVDSLIEFDQQKQGNPIPWGSSRLFVYWFTRYLMGTTNYDSGVDNRTMLKACNQYGFCPESLWPYDVSQFRRQPSSAAVSSALPNRITSYAAVDQSLDGFRSCLAAGFPFLFGFTVYSSFESSAVESTGDVPMPSRREGVLGGHDVVVYGYDDATQRAKFLNSWGDDWGRGGHGTFPYAYITDPNLSGDFWVVNGVPGAPLPPSPPPVPPSPPTPEPAEGQVVIDLDGHRVTVPAGWIVAGEDLERAFNRTGLDRKKRGELLTELLALLRAGPTDAKVAALAKRFGISPELIALIIQLLIAILGGL